MAFRSISGSKIIGQGQPQAVPIQLDPAPYKGAVAYGTDGLIYVSNGTAWNAVGAGIQGTTGIQGDSGLQGLQGEYGPGFTIIGSVADVDTGGDPQATLNAAFPSANIGEGVIDEADDELWIYDGTTWVNIGSFRGVQGFTGNQGIQGIQGTIGEEGIQGSRGFRGFQGLQGIQGTTGIQGTQGIQGIQGTQGVQGVQGVQGTTGIQGDTGAQGIQGPQSIQGTTGIQGDTGAQGTTGSYGGISFEFAFDDAVAAADPGSKNLRYNNAAVASTTAIYVDAIAGPSLTDISAIWNALDASTNPIKGYIKLTKVDDISVFAVFQVTEVTDNTGWFTLAVTYVNSNGAFALSDDLIVSLVESGAQGVQGPQSTQGVQGVQGVQGLLGFQGTQGPQSTQGVQGDTGIQGMQGTQGLQGVQGLQGIQGTTGIQGAQGVQGIQGTQGVQGTTGIQGDTGVQGIQGGSGLQGIQGTQGIQGDLGVQGIQGFQGTNGFQGATGIQGDTGVQGFAGVEGGLTFRWQYNSSTTAGFPGLNSWLLNDADVTAVTELYIDDLTETGRRVDALFDLIDGNSSSPKGQIFIKTPRDTSGDYEFLIYNITDWIWDAGTDWGHFTVEFVERSTLGGTDLSPGTSWTTGAAATYGNDTIITFILAGDKGTQGIQGIQGTTGIQGSAGSYGGSSFEYDFTPDTAPTGPASGIFKFNNVDITAATVLRISESDTFGNDLGAFLASLDDNSSITKAYIKLSSVANPAEFAIYGMTSETDAGAYVNMAVTFLSKSTNMSSTYLTNNTDTIISFTTSGDAGIQGPQGVQGLQGIQGDFGLQGADGAGSQGIQGVQGDLGFQGVQGFPGPIGPQGIQGADGLQGGGGFQGATGSFGGITFDYTYSTNVAKSDPGPGILKFNNATLSSATSLYIDDRDDGFTDIQTYLRTIDDSTSPIKGHFRIAEKLDPAKFVLFTVSALQEESGYFDVTCGYITGSVSNFTDATDIIITFARTGDIGPAGIQGIQGFDGFQGSQGLSGTGLQGIQGLQGFQGATAAQGLQGTAGFVGGSGTQGSQGTQGVQGPQGIAGTDGDEGFQGSQGVQGPQSADGAQGIQGFQGFQGIAGIGATGIQGFQGIQGTALQGSQGVQGLDGPPGFGNQGVQGFQGSQGTKGDIGSQGTQGIGGQGTSGLQGIQGIQGTTSAQGLQGVSGEGNQGTQGTQGAAGIGNTGIQGDVGFQGVQGIVGGLGGDGLQGPQGTDGLQGLQGIDGGLGNSGAQGMQGIQGDLGFQGAIGGGTQGLQGTQGIQGSLGFQGPPGQGTQGVQGVQAAQGVQGLLGFQGIQGVQGPGIQGGVENIQNVHETSVQDTSLFITMVEAGASHRPILGTLGPNPGGESNFFYQSDIDTLTVENLEVIGNLTVTGSTSAASITGITDDIFIPSDTYLGYGGSDGNEYVKASYNTSLTSFVFDTNTSVTSNIAFKEQGGSNVFTFNMQTGAFTATGDVTTNSDMRLKENVKTIDNALEKVSNMRGVYFDMKQNPGQTKIGLIAQEVEEIIPEAVITSDKGEHIKSVSYGNIVGLLVEAIKDLKKEVDDLKV